MLITAARSRWACSLFGQKLINIDQQIVAQKSMLVAITAPSTGT
jgi:hypothetical protein